MTFSCGDIFRRMPDRLRDNRQQLFLLLLLSAVAYWEVPGHSFLINWDDHVYITLNYAIREISLQNLKTVFSEYYVGNYAPVQMLSYMLDYALWGNDPTGYFLANISYHLISGFLLYFLLIRLGAWKWGAFIGTAVFLVHPVQVESVAWLSQRKNLLAMLPYLLSFHAYLSYRDSVEQTSRRRFYLLSVAAFSAALLSKSVAVIFPVMLMMYDQLIPPVRGAFAAHKDKLPYFIAAAIVGGVALISQGGSHGGGRIEYPPDALTVLPLTMLPVLMKYLLLVVWPDPSFQSIMYFPPLRSGIDQTVIICCCLLFVLIAAGFYLYRTNRPVLFWYGLFFLGLLPVSQIVPLATMMNDRYLYFPMLGGAGLVAHLAGVLKERAGTGAFGRALPVVCAGILLTLSVASHMRGKVWRNSISLFSDAVAKYPSQTSTWSRLAEGYVAAGNIAMAQYYYEKAATFGPLDADARHNLARIYLIVREYDKAYQEIWWLLLRGDQNRENLILLGEYYFRVGLYPEAEQNIRLYLEEYPGSMHGLYLLGRVQYMSGNPALAKETLSRAVAEGGATGELLYGIACIEFGEGHPDTSLSVLKAAFEAGLKYRDLNEDEACLAGMRGDVRFREMVRPADNGTLP